MAEQHQVVALGHSALDYGARHVEDHLEQPNPQDHLGYDLSGCKQEWCVCQCSTWHFLHGLHALIEIVLFEIRLITTKLCHDGPCVVAVHPGTVAKDRLIRELL